MLFHRVIAVAMALVANSSTAECPVPSDAPQVIMVDSVSATTQELSPLFHESVSSRRVKTSFGPLCVPESSHNYGRQTWVVAAGGLSKPCDDCLIYYFRCGLEYPADGSGDGGDVANLDSGMELHRVIFNNTDKAETTCVDLNERFVAFGNERLVVDLSANGTQKFGYHLSTSDDLAAVFMLGNSRDYAREAVITVEWEFITLSDSDPDVDGDTWTSATPLFLNVAGGCGPLDIDPSGRGDVFTLELDPPFFMPPASSAGTSRYVAGMGAHLLDGGVEVEVLQNGVSKCISKAGYGEFPGYVEENGGSGSDDHISSMETCHDLGMTEEGDKWTIRASYDFTVHQPATLGEGGDVEMAPVMGAAVAYFLEKGNFGER